MKVLHLLSVLGLATIALSADPANVNRYKLFKVESIEELEEREQAAIEQDRKQHEQPKRDHQSYNGENEHKQKEHKKKKNHNHHQEEKPEEPEPALVDDLKNNPVFGIVTEPTTKDQPSRLREEKTEYVPMEHVNYLQAAGARVVPVSFLLPESELIELLSKLNGIYVPGDNKACLDNPDYVSSIEVILKYVKEQNEFYNSFPAVFMNWSFNLMLRLSSHQVASAFDTIPDLYLSTQRVSQKVGWENSFILHEAHPLERDHLYRSMQQPFLLDKALSVQAMDKELRDKFFVVSTFEAEDVEFVAMVEGKRAPIFGLAYSPQKSQFATEAMKQLSIDQTMKARYHAQFMANYFVDAARESQNKFASFEEEKRRLINRFPSVFVEEKVGRHKNKGEKWHAGVNKNEAVHTQSIYAFKFSDIRF